MTSLALINELIGLPANASEHGYQIDHIIEFCHWFMGSLFVGWSVFFIFVLWRFHKRRNPVASHEGVTAAEAIAQELGNKDVHPHATDPKNIPGCTYCQPQVASIGLTEAAAKAKGLQLKVGKFPFIGNGKAIALGEPEGFIKTIFDAKTGELLGAHMIGAEVTELIQGYSVAKTLETTEAELMATVFPHPTLSEMMHESVLAAYGRTLHI